MFITYHPGICLSFVAMSSCRRHVVVMSSSCRRHVVVVSSSCRRHVVVVSSSCRRRVVVVPSSCRRHVVVMSSSCRRHVVVVSSSCRRHVVVSCPSRFWPPSSVCLLNLANLCINLLTVPSSRKPTLTRLATCACTVVWMKVESSPLQKRPRLKRSGSDGPTVRKRRTFHYKWMSKPTYPPEV